MSSQLRLLCNRFIEAGWLAGFILIPLHFNPATTRIYEPDKIALLRSIAVCVAVAWLIKAVEAWMRRRQQPAPPQPPQASWQALWRHPASRVLILAALLWLASHTLSTLFSMLPITSLWGHYDRMYGLYTLASYLVLFFSMLALLRTQAQVQRLITTALLASLPMALYGIVQNFDVELHAWMVTLTDRVASTMGNPIFLGATLAMVVPLTLYRVFEAERAVLAAETRLSSVGLRLLGGATVTVQIGSWSIGLVAGSLVALLLVVAWGLVPRWGRRPYGPFLRWSVYLLLLSMQLACLLFTQSRGPALGLVVGLFLGGLLWTLTRQQRRAALGLVGLSMLLAALLVGINLSTRALEVVSEIPYLSRLVQLSTEDGSSQGRVLIWEGAIDLITNTPKRLIIGYGPETTRSAFYPYYSAEMGRLEGWNLLPDRLHNTTLDTVATTGLLGGAIYLLLITSIVYVSLSRLGLLATTRQRTGFLGLWLAGGVGATLGLRGIMQSWTFSGVALSLGLLTGLFLYLAGYALVRRPASETENASAPRSHRVLLIVLFTGILIHFVETIVGFPVSATQYLFWSYAALLLIIGLLSDSQAPSDDAPAPEPDHSRPKSTAKARRRSKAKASTRQPPSGRRLHTGSLGVGLILLTLVYGLTTPAPPAEKQGVIAAFLLASWLLLGLCLFVDLTREHRTRYRLRDLGLYGLFSLAPSLLFVLLRATGLDMKNFQLLAFYGLVLLTIGALSILLRADTPLRGLPASPWRIAFAAASILASLPFIYATTIQGIQANMDHRRATLAYAQKRYDVAMVWCQQAVERAPHQVRYQMELAQALGAQAIFDARVTTDRERLFREAEQTLFRAVETNPFDAYPQAQLAEIYRVWANLTEDADNKAARYEEAVAALELAVLYNPENLAFMTKWAELYDELGEQALALATYRRALALDTTNAPLYMKVGRYYQEASQWQPAAAMYEAALRHSRQPLPAVHHTLAVLYQRLEHPEEAARQSEQAVAHAPDVPAYHTLLIDLYLHLGRCTEAREQAQAALRRWPAEAALQPHADRLAQQCPEQPAPG